MNEVKQSITPGAVVKAVFYILGLAALVYGFNAFLDAEKHRCQAYTIDRNEPMIYKDEKITTMSQG
jgi:hypothetical protein